MTKDGRAALLRALVADELAIPVDPRVSAMAAAIAARYGPASRAVLFYGSCLREARLEGLMLDFYLIVSDYRDAFGPGWLAFANRLLPPNVFPFEHGGLVAKYAVLSESDFTRLASSATRNVSVWARFAQPSRLAWAASEVTRRHVATAVTEAAPALIRAARPLLDDTLSIAELWSKAFELTYGAELRAERKVRAVSVFDADPERYRMFTPAVLAAAGLDARIERGGILRFADEVPHAEKRAARRLWARRRREGKLLTLARLAKATTTYAGGIDYLAWKINRHAGAAIAIRPWQRRWPILGALSLLPRLLLRGAVR